MGGLSIERIVQENTGKRYFERWMCATFAMLKRIKERHLRASPVVVQTGEAGEVLFGNGGSRLGSNETVGVGRVPHDQHLTHTHTDTLQNNLT